jgi:hypothetical protein
MIEDIVIERMSHGFIFWCCLHFCPLEPGQIDTSCAGRHRPRLSIKQASKDYDMVGVGL